MAGSKTSGCKLNKLSFIGLEPDEAPPRVSILAVATNGEVIHKVSVNNEGEFEFPTDSLKEARWVLIGPADAEISDSKAFSRYRPNSFERMLDKDINVARPLWENWRFLTQCVTGSVYKCFRSHRWFDGLVALSKTDVVFQKVMKGGGTSTGWLPAARSIPEHLALQKRCWPICNGVVEVWRRTCCCEPWVIYDPRLDDLLYDLEKIGQIIPEIPGTIPPPRPPPPGPLSTSGTTALADSDFGEQRSLSAVDLQQPFIKEGALDEFSLYAAQDLAALKRLSAADIPEYINARSYLFCRSYSCSTPTKVAEGEINPDGRFNICWQGSLYVLRVGCNEEYAYKVRQKFGYYWITVYNGVSTNNWFSAGADARLETYHSLSFACRPPGEPGTGAYVYLDLIGDTSSHELETPNAEEWDRVFNPGATGGTLFKDPSPYGHKRNLGDTLKLNYMFSEDLKLLGAKYYRISVIEADTGGDPVGTRQYYSDGVSWTKAVASGSGVDIVPVSLGPNPAPIGGQNYLYEIPFDLSGGEDWEAGQYHARLDTFDPKWSNPLVRHLVTVEIFDTNGKRLRPNGTPATGQSGTEDTAAFTYRRKPAATGPTDNVPFGALTHLLWWDNRDLFANIDGLRKEGLVSDADCQFLLGVADSQFSIDYTAYHPEELFQRDHKIHWKRGLSGGHGTLLPLTPGNVGYPPPPGTSPSKRFGEMLDIENDSTRTRCAFTVALTIYGKRTDGDDYSYPYVTKSAAFALEIES